MLSEEFVSSLGEHITKLIDLLKKNGDIDVLFVINNNYFTPTTALNKASKTFTITLPKYIDSDYKKTLILQLISQNAKHIYLETENLIIKPLDISYVKDYYELCSDESVMIPSGDKILKNLNEAYEDIKIEQDYGNSSSIILKSEDKLIGAVVFYLRLNQFMEIGYDINSKYQGKGFATEAISKLIDYAFSTLGCEYIIARTFLDNSVSEHILNKLGFKFIEIIKNDYLHQEYKTYYDTKNFILFNTPNNNKK